MLTDKQKSELAKPIPQHAIHRKQGKLDYVKGGWVKQRLNEIFGPDGWSWEILKWEASESISDKGKQMFAVRVQGRLTAGGTYREALAAGTGYGADGWHQAMGEGDTDAFKRAASAFGNAIGGMLYLADDDKRRVDTTALDAVAIGLREAVTTEQLATWVHNERTAIKALSSDEKAMLQKEITSACSAIQNNRGPNWVNATPENVIGWIRNIPKAEQQKDAQ